MKRRIFTLASMLLVVWLFASTIARAQEPDENNVVDGTFEVDREAAGVTRVEQPRITIPSSPLAPTLDVPLDIVLVQDETGSMADDISSLRSLAPQIWDGIDALTSADFQMSVVGFRDYARSPWGNSADWVYRRIVDLTPSRDAFVSAVNLLTAYGGYDEPESQYPALYYSLTRTHPCIDSNGDGDCLDSFDTSQGQQSSFRSGARKIILLATDASFHDPLDTSGYPGPTPSAVVDSLINNRAVVIGLVPGGAGRIPEVDALAAATGGSTQNTGSSGQAIAEAIISALGSIHAIDPVLSSVEVSAASVPADGTTAVEITVTLRDTEGVPVPGRTVLLTSSRGALDIIEQSDVPTDDNGRLTVTARSFMPGTATFTAIDVVDNILLSQRPAVEFVGEVVAPGEALQRSIDLLHNYSIRALDNINRTVSDAGEDGDYFATTLTMDAARLAVDAVLGFARSTQTVREAYKPAVTMKMSGIMMEEGVGWARIEYFKATWFSAGNLFNTAWRDAIRNSDWAGLTVPVLEDGWSYYGAELVEDAVVEEVGFSVVREVLGRIMPLPGGLSQISQILNDDIPALREALGEQHGLVLAGVPPMPDDVEQAYADDVRQRAMAALILSGTLEHQYRLLESARISHDSIGGGWEVFILKFVAKTAATATFDGPGAAAVEGFTRAFDLYLDAKRIQASGRAYLAAPGILKGGAEAAELIYQNEASGLDRITTQLPPRALSGVIQDVRHYSAGRGGGPLWFEDGSYSEVDLLNTGTERTVYQLLTEYSYFDRLLGLPWAYVPLVEEDIIVLSPGETATVRVDYKDQELGGSPDEGSNLSVNVLARNESGTFFIDFDGSEWHPRRVSSSPRIPLSPVDTELPGIANPLDLYVTAADAADTFEARFWIANPFTTTITTTITQTLPAAAILVDTDGTVNGSTVAWQHTIAATDLVSATITFQYPAVPGAELQLPAAEMSFVEPNSGEVAVTTSNVPTFVKPLPVDIRSEPAVTSFAVDATMPVTVTNLTGADVAGTLKLRVLDDGAAILYEEERLFGLDALGTSQIAFDLPGQLRPGWHRVELWVEIAGGNALAYSDLYQINGSQSFLPALQRR